jgi:bifunctional DNA-binding transcriptional regulator/antitoxin component of YhaV-PrlF toxin-antitoxin module
MSDSENTSSPTISEGAISGNQASIPAPIRARADIEDGDKLRWYWENGELSVEVIRQRTGVFEDFDGFEGDSASFDHDRGGLTPSGDATTSPPEE